MIKLIIAGGRDFCDHNLLKKEVNEFVRELNVNQIIVVNGGAQGADKLGKQYGEHYKQIVVDFPADWDKYGKSAGYIRNAQMAKYADACIVFWDGKSKGTKHMIDLANKEGIKLKIVMY